MTQVRVRKYHECDKPKMIVAWKKIVSRRFPLFWKLRVVNEPVYYSRVAEWSCPECGAKWEWRGEYWFCAGRPDEYEMIDVE